MKDLRSLMIDRYKAVPPRSSRRDRQRHDGQTLVEFALVIPLFLVLLLGTIEFAFIFNATLNVNYASRNASLIAAEAGSNASADCLILRTIESDLNAPLDRSLIQSIRVFKADRAGNPVAGVENVYTRDTVGPPLVCGSISVPYALAGTPGYTDRCDRLAGCLVAGSSPPVYTPLDSIGVEILYEYRWHTPLRNFVPLPGSGTGQLDLRWSNVMRMEPIL